MSLRNRLVVPIILSGLAVLAGCGGSGTSKPTPPPSGAFSNTNFNGNYTFSVLGADAGTGSGSVFAMAGTLTACGCAAGTISGGSVDLVNNVGPIPAAAIGSNSTYKITKDGRGFARLMITPTVGTPFEVDVDFVLTSSTHGLITRYDGSGTGSGTIDSQNLVAQAGLANLPFAFSLTGSDSVLNPLSTVGAFTLDASGNISASGSNAGVEDFAYGFPATSYPQLPLSGVVQVGSGTAPGTATLMTPFVPAGLSFDVYIVDSSHLKLIESDGSAILVGDVFTQPSATIPSGNLVFTMAGLDQQAFPFAAGGLMSSDGSSLIPSGSEDVNDDGVVDGGTTTPQAFSGSFSSTGGGRFQVSLLNFFGGGLFAAYPSSGGVLMLEIDTGLTAGITSGVALAQTSTSISNSSGYGLNLTGVDVNGEIDEIAEFTTTSTGFKGLLDENEGGIPSSPQNLSGTYTVGSDGAGSASLNAGLAGMFFYVADSSTVVFLSTDSGQVALGAFQTQSTPTSLSGMAQEHLSVLRSLHLPHAASLHHKTRLGHAK